MSQIMVKGPDGRARKIGVAIVGFGASARIFHAPLVGANPDFCITGFVERNSRKGEAMWPKTTTWTSVDHMLADDRVELVVICSPNTTHHALAVACLMAGRHVLVEKPFTVTLEEAEDLCAIAKGTGKILTVFHNRRFDGDFLTIKDLIVQNRLGRVVEVRMAFDRWAPAIRSKVWKEDGAQGNQLLDDLGSHLIDQAVQLFGMPRSVWAWTACQRDNSRVDDAFSLTMEYDDKKVILEAGMLARFSRPRFSMIGTKGNFVKYGLDPQEHQLGNGISPAHPDYGMEDPVQYGVLDVIDDSGTNQGKVSVPTVRGKYPEFYSRLYDSITQGTPPPVLPSEACNVMHLLTAARRSSQTKNTVFL